MPPRPMARSRRDSRADIRADAAMWADGVLIQRQCGAEVDKGSGTCSSVSLCLRVAAAQTARPATFNATLRWETVSEQVRHRLPDAPPHTWPAHQSPALIRESGQESVTGQAGHRLLLVSHPRPLKGSMIARETECQRDRQCPESAIIT